MTLRYNISCLALGAVLLMAMGPAQAQPAQTDEPLSVGLVIPQSGPFKILGDQIRDAFTLWNEENPGVFSDIVEDDDQCTEQSGKDAAAAMSEAGVNIVVGFLCIQSLASALPVLSEEGIPAMTISVRADIIGEQAKRMGWSFFRLAPRASQQPEIAADAIVKLWADKPFALIEDGAISGRELVQSIRSKLEERGLTPRFVDNYRPAQATQPSLIRRLQSAGVTHVFVGGERQDLGVIAKEAAYQKVPLSFMGGDTLNAPKGENPIPDGTLAILAIGEIADKNSAAARADFKKHAIIADGMHIPAYAAAEILGTVATHRKNSETALSDLLKQVTFTTALGPVTFDENGERREPGFMLAIMRNGEFTPLNLDEKAAQTAAQTRVTQSGMNQ